MKIAIGAAMMFPLDMRGGRVGYAVLTFTAFLGTEAKLFAVPWGALTLDATSKRFVLEVQKDRVKDADAPGFDKSHGPDMAGQTWQDGIHVGAKSVLPPLP